MFRIGERYIAHIDCDQQRLLHKLVVALIRVHPTFGRHDDAVDVAVIHGVICMVAPPRMSTV